jgi:hypothetical protein
MRRQNINLMPLQWQIIALKRRSRCLPKCWTDLPTWAQAEGNRQSVADKVRPEPRLASKNHLI